MSWSPEVWRGVNQEKILRKPEASVAAELNNPGLVYEFHGQFYKKEGNTLVPCSEKEIAKTWEAITERRGAELKQQQEEEKIIAKRAKELGWDKWKIVNGELVDIDSLKEK